MNWRYVHRVWTPGLRPRKQGLGVQTLCMAILLLAFAAHDARADCPAAPIADADDMVVSFLSANGTQAAPSSLLPSSVKEGMLVYDDTANKLKVCNGTAWVDVGSGSGTDTLSSLSCASGEIAKYNGSAWACAADGGTAGPTNAPAFRAYRSAAYTSASGGFKFDYDTEAYDTTNSYDLSSDQFVAPLSGKYLFTAIVAPAVVGTVAPWLQVNGANVAWGNYESTNSGNHRILSSVVALNAGDTVQLWISNNSGVTSWNVGQNYSAFTGTMLDFGSGSDTLAGLSCATNEIAKWNGTAWACAADGGGSGSGQHYGFSASKSTAGTFTSASYNVLTGWIEDNDVGAVFNPATGVFKAPVAGFYAFTGLNHMATTAGNYYSYIGLNGSLSRYGSRFSNSGTGSAGSPMTNVSSVMYLNANDEVTFGLYSDANGTNQYASFSGAYLGGGGSSQWTTLGNDLHYGTGGVAIGQASAPDASAALELESTTKGFLPPRMTTVQRDAIASPATGLMIFDTTAAQYQFWNGTAWSGLGSGSVPAGTIAAFALTACPSGWTEYTAARGRFLRGIDNGAGNDPSGTRAPGATQADDFKSHTHPGGPWVYNAHGPNGSGVYLNGGYGLTSGVGATGGAETRPKNVAVLFCQYSGSGGSGGATTLAELTDVDLSALANGKVLTYNSTSSKWEATTAATGSASTSNVGYVQLGAASGAFTDSGTAAGQQLFWDNTNKRLGIGTTAPGALIDVVTTGAGTTVRSNNAGILRSNGSGRDVNLRLSDTATNSAEMGMLAGDLYFTNNGVEHLRISNAGNVGIGTATPTNALLQLVGESEASGVTDAGVKTATLRIDTSNVPVGAGGSLEFGISGTAAKYYAAIKGNALNATTNSIGDLTFLTRNAIADTALTERMRITSTGFVGIGVNPAAKLHVGGNISSAAWTTNGIGLRYSSAIYTDTSSSGTVAATNVHAFGQPTLAASAATTFTNANTLYLVGPPLAGSNVTITNPNTLNVASGSSIFGGNVGIGTASPGYPLTVATGSAQFTSALHVLPSTHATSRRASLGLDDWFILQDTNGNGTKDLSVYQASAAKHRLNIATDGNVGIGTAAPSSALTVVGTNADIGMNSSDTNVVGLLSSTTRASSRQAFYYNHDASASLNDLYLGSAFEVMDGAAGAPTFKNAGSASVNPNVMAIGHSGIRFLRGPAAAVGTALTLSESMRIDTSGFVGIGTVNPTAKLHVFGGNIASSGMAAPGLIVTPTSGSSYIFGANTALAGAGLYDNTAGTWRIVAKDTSGFVGIGTTAPSYALQVNGAVAGTSAYVNTSDARLKTDVHNLADGLDTVMRLRPVSFRWKEQKENWQKGRKLGLIAQEVETVLPEIVSTANDDMGTKSIAYGDLTPVLIRAIQELKADNDNLHAEREVEIEALREEIKALKAAIH